MTGAGTPPALGGSPPGRMHCFSARHVRPVASVRPVRRSSLRPVCLWDAELSWVLGPARPQARSARGLGCPPRHRLPPALAGSGLHTRRPS